MKKVNINLLKEMLIALAFLLVFCCTAISQNEIADIKQGQSISPPQSTIDKNFIIEAYSGAMMESERGKAAKIQSDNVRIKDYGDMMAHDHILANDALKSIADGMNIKVPDRLDKAHKEEIDLLQAKSTADFNRSYLDMTVAGHKEIIMAFEKASTDVADPKLKEFAVKHLPDLKMHLDSAIAIQKSLK